jgi:exopolyphosphatase / guanosine-5'-triphosphate,3'-diphosphate pyrophosphatase
MPAPRFAAIDIGSNTVRLIIGERIAAENFRPLRIEREITRLGGSFSPQAGLSESSMERTVKAVARLTTMARKSGVASIFAVATGVVRAAINRESFLKRIREEADLPIRLLSGIAEGQLMWRGVRWSLRDSPPSRLAADIGGWSTEFIWVEKELARKIKSVDLGVVALCEQFLKHDPPRAAELRDLENLCHRRLCQVRDQLEKDGLVVRHLHPALVGTAGTMTTLAAIELGLTIYDPGRVNHHLINKAEIQRIYQGLSALAGEERQKVPGLERGREDLIVAGGANVLAILEVFELHGLRVIETGLLEGVLLDGLSCTPWS